MWKTMENIGWLRSSTRPSSSSSSTSSGDSSYTYNNGMDSVPATLGDDPGGPIGDCLGSFGISVYTGPQPYSDYDDAYIEANGFLIGTSYEYENGWLTEYTHSYYVTDDGRMVPYEDPHSVWEPCNPNPSSNANTNSNGTSSDGTGSSESGEKIICIELYRQGLMPKEIFEADEAFGEILKRKYPLVLKGYQFWARPVVKQMRASQSFTKTVYMVAKPWSMEMAHIMGKRDTGSIIGKVLMLVGFPICWLIGFVMVNKLFVTLISSTFVVLWLFRKYMTGEKKSGQTLQEV